MQVFFQAIASAEISFDLVGPTLRIYATRTMRGILIVLAVFFAGLSSAAEVYRWVDESGSVVYSDRPHPGAEKLETGPVQTVPAIVPKPVGHQTKSGTSAAAYLTFAIIAPTDQENIHNPPDGNVKVSILLQPSLDMTHGHRLTLQVDNQRLGEPGRETEFIVPNIDRGTHLLQAVILDQNNVVVGTTPTITFHVHRAAVQTMAP